MTLLSNKWGFKSTWCVQAFQALKLLPYFKAKDINHLDLMLFMPHTPHYAWAGSSPGFKNLWHKIPVGKGLKITRGGAEFTVGTYRNL